VKSCLDAIQGNIPPKTAGMISFMRWATSEMSLSPSGARKYRWPLWIDRGLWTVTQWLWSAEPPQAGRRVRFWNELGL